MALDKEFLLDGDISLKEKYLSFDKEKRIRRMQFFERMLIPGVLLALFVLFPSLIVGFIFSPENSLKWSFYLTTIFYIINFLLVLKYYPVIIQKRAHDFGKEGKIETYILLGGTALTYIIAIYAQYLSSNMDLAGIMGLMKYSGMINALNGILTLIWLYLLFRPGTKGVNKYGEQKYYKLKFLG